LQFFCGTGYFGVILTSLVCISDAWFGYIRVKQLNVIIKLFVKAHTWGLTKNLYSADELFAKRDQQQELFKAMLRNSHCLSYILLVVACEEGLL